MRSREEVLTEYNIERDEEDGCLILPQHRDTIINALADRIRELESPPRPEPVACEAYDTHHECIVRVDSELLAPNDGHPWRYRVQYPSGVCSTQDADKLRFFAAHPSATAGAEVVACAARYIAALDRVADAKTAREVAQTARGVANKGDVISEAHRALAAATDERDAALGALRVCLMEVDRGE